MDKAATTWIEKINDTIAKYSPKEMGIIDGMASRLLYYYEFYRATGNNMFKTYFEQVKGQLMAKFEKQAGETDCRLLPGISGILWLFYEMKTDGLSDGLSDEEINLVNEQLVKEALAFIGEQKSSYPDGAYGILYYLLLSEQTPDTINNTGKILAQIAAGYIKGDVYRSFGNSYNVVHGNYELNLGLFNGLCGQLLILLKCCSLGYNRQYPTLELLLKDGVGFILQHKMDIDYEDEYYSFFPPAVSKHSGFVETSNVLAWFGCDLNQVQLLYEMTLLTGNTHYKEAADYIGLQTIARKSFDETQVNGSSIFNGSAGIAMMYKKLSTYSNKDEYLAAFRYWMEKTTIYLQKEMDKVSFASHELGILNGLTGTSLALLSYAYATEPKWTKLFFL